MASEQIQAEGVDERVDIYSLGVTLYDMLADELPFQADTPMAVMHQVVHQPLPRLDSLLPLPPREVRDLVI